MSEAELDLMIEFAVTSLAKDDDGAMRSMVRSMAHRWPNQPALAIAFSITSAASTLEDIVDSKRALGTARTAYRLAALVAADTFAIEQLCKRPALGQDLLHFWRRVDPYFSDL